MSRDDVKMLRDRDADKRKVAIKKVAKAKNKNALKQLAKMAGDDPDPEVRSLAQKAGVYIRQQIGEIPQEHKLKEGEVYVSDKDKAAAQKLLSEAMTHQINEDKTRQIQALQKALALDSNLRTDGYFVSLSESATGEQGAAAILSLGDEERQKRIAREEARARRDAEITEHWDEVSGTGWQDVIFDITLYFIITAVGTMLLTFIVIQSATGLLNRIDASFEAALAATANEDGVLVDEEGNEISIIELEEGFEELTETLNETSFVQVAINGLFVGVSAVISAFVFNGVTHFISRRLFGGAGNFPYLMHRWTTLISSRSIVVFFLTYISIALIFSEGGAGIIALIPLGLAGIVSLVTLGQVILVVGKSYNFGFIKAFVSVILSAIIAGIFNAGLTITTGISFY